MGCVFSGRQATSDFVTTINVTEAQSPTSARLQLARNSGAASPEQIIDDDLTRPLMSPSGAFSALRRRRRISSMLGEFNDALNGYMENRDHPFLGEDRLRHLFHVMDADRSGSLDIPEVQAFWKRMGWSHSLNALSTMFNLADTNGSGRIEYDEFAKFFRRLGSIDELAHNPAFDDWIPGAAEEKKLPRGRTWPPGTRPLLRYDVVYHRGQTTRVKCLSVDPTRNYYASCGRDDLIAKLYDLKTGEEMRTFASHHDTVVCIAISSDRKHIATGSRDGLMILWDVISGVVVEQLDHPAVVTSCAFAPDDKFLFSGCLDGVVRKWTVNRARLVTQSEKLGRGVVVTMVHLGKMLAVSLSREKAVQLLDPRSVKCRWVLKGHSTMVSSVGGSNDGRRVMTACEQFVRVWDSSSLALLRCFPVSSRERFCTPAVAIHEPSAASENPLQASGKWAERERQQESPKWIAACFQPGDFNHYLCASCSDRGLYFYNTTIGSCILVIPTRWPVYCLSSHAESQSLCVGDEQGNIGVIKLG
eukprot:Hpha_TRINITY_DN15131_c1_g1::TRINITY_DN15131_c1_g1_i1::g.128153::m.128153